MIITALLSLFLNVFAITATAEPNGRWLVELKTQDDGCLIAWWNAHGLDNTPFLKKKLPVGNWWVVTVPSGLSASLMEQPCVVSFTPDQKIEWRKQPNDPAYVNQGDMNLIGMPKAWDITTGGVTAAGDTIVVALIDEGYQTDHQDLVQNIWISRGEIQDDGIDNDNNGYIDDRVGYNIQTSDDHHLVKSHGTSVAGIVGAKGNNGVGVTGVNWNVKLLLISGADFESDVIAAYQYALDMRKLYDQTNGAKGAFIVATNLSGGINNAFAADHPLWCEMYDKLGEKGILSVASAPNQSISVDVDGDMPTTCTSPFLIAVTNVDTDDEIVGNAGYGATSIDIGAPGHGTVTTASVNVYKEFPGTSAAAPHVAGAIALLYSTPCAEFLYDLDSDPSNTARRIRDLIFNTAKPNNSLNEITVTGKRIQVDAALKASVTDCGAPIETMLEITSIRPNPAWATAQIRIYFKISPDIQDPYFEVFSSTGAKLYEIRIDQAIAQQGYIELDGRNLLAAVYMITLRGGDRKVTRKLVTTI